METTIGFLWRSLASMDFINLRLGNVIKIYRNYEIAFKASHPSFTHCGAAVLMGAKTGQRVHVHRGTESLKASGDEVTCRIRSPSCGQLYSEFFNDFVHELVTQATRRRHHPSGMIKVAMITQFFHNPFPGNNNNNN